MRARLRGWLRDFIGMDEMIELSAKNALFRLHSKQLDELMRAEHRRESEARKAAMVPIHRTPVLMQPEAFDFVVEPDEPKQRLRDSHLG